MYTQTKLQIIEFLKKNKTTTVKELVQYLGITQAAVHRALNKLMDLNEIEKQGSPPKVFYSIKSKTVSFPFIVLDGEQKKLLDEHYLYIEASGQVLEGLPGFLSWMRATKNQQKPENCIADYIQVLKETESLKNRSHLIDATERFKSVFSDLHMDEVFYHEFYSLIKFGKTKMGQLLLHGKQAQDKKIIKLISQKIKPSVLKLIKEKKIEALAWAPHSLPRKIPFLKELKSNLNLELPVVEILKAYKGPIPIAQKSLSKIEERIKNARETMIVVPSQISYKNVLIIDDAIGSGATLNEIADKLKDKGVKKVVGFAIVGSYKGFEVIKEV